MAPHLQSERFALRSPYLRGLPDGAWWPRGRQLSHELAGLFALWPPEAGWISRVLFSPPDWDDHPRSVDTGHRRVKTGSFPQDDTHQLILTMLDGRRLTISVIPPDTPHLVVRRLLADFSPAPAPAEEVPFTAGGTDGSLA